jgi:steroid delta-isomerase-like uncharacterized protein
MGAVSEENKTLVRRFFEEVVNDRNLDLLEELFAVDYIHHDPTLPPDMPPGLDGFKAVLTMFFDAFPDFRGTMEDLVGERDKVASRVRWRGTHQGELMGIPPSGNQVNFTLQAIHRIAEGKIVEGWINFDALGMMRQIGAIPEPGQAQGA